MNSIHQRITTQFNYHLHICFRIFALHLSPLRIYHSGFREKWKNFNGKTATQTSLRIVCGAKLYTKCAKMNHNMMITSCQLYWRLTCIAISQPTLAHCMCTSAMTTNQAVWVDERLMLWSVVVRRGKTKSANAMIIVIKPWFARPSLNYHIKHYVYSVAKCHTQRPFIIKMLYLAADWRRKKRRRGGRRWWWWKEWEIKTMIKSGADFDRKLKREMRDTAMIHWRSVQFYYASFL